MAIRENTKFMKETFILITVVFLLVGCRTVKQAAQTTTIVVADTVQVLPATPLVIPKKSLFDSVSYKNLLFNEISNNKIVFTTFSAKAKVDFAIDNTSDNATAFVRIKKDSLIWVSLRGALGIEGARVLITPDSLIVFNTLKKELTRRSIGFLQELSKLPFDFYTLQDVLIGNPVYLIPNIISVQANPANELAILMRTELFEHLLTINATDKTPRVSNLQFNDRPQKLACVLKYDGFDRLAGFSFATKRTIEVSEKTKAKFVLDIKSFSFNEPLTFPFDLPRKVKEL